jgi:hypothetical protein
VSTLVHLELQAQYALPFVLVVLSVRESAMNERLRGKTGSPHPLDTGYLTEPGLPRHAPQEKQIDEFQTWPVDVFLEDCMVGRP